MHNPSINKINLVRPAIATGLILLIPLTLQLTIGTGVDGQGFNWRPGDFLVIGILIFLTSFAFEVVSKKITDRKYKIFAGILIILLFLFIWAGMVHGIWEEVIEKVL